MNSQFWSHRSIKGNGLNHNSSIVEMGSGDLSSVRQSMKTPTSILRNSS
jgi:hypothetical protein